MAFLSPFGKMLALIVEFIRFVIGVTSAGFPSLSNFTEILSPPVALLGLNLSIIFETVFSSVFLNSKGSLI